MANRCDLRLIALAFFTFAGNVSSVRYLKIGVIHVSLSSSTTGSTSVALIDFSFSSSTNTCLLKCAKLVDAILHNCCRLNVKFMANETSNFPMLDMLIILTHISDRNQEIFTITKLPPQSPENSGPSSNSKSDNDWKNETSQRAFKDSTDMSK
ncbi:hypothetical protein Tco_1213118 [Tanacetum coccineum]